MSKGGIIFCFIVATANCLQAQTNKKETDSTQVKNLPDVTVVGRNSKSDYQQMPEIVGTNIYAGKKNALIITSLTVTSLMNAQGVIDLTTPANDIKAQILSIAPIIFGIGFLIARVEVYRW